MYLKLITQFQNHLSKTLLKTFIFCDLALVYNDTVDKIDDKL